MVMELMRGGELLDRILKHKSLSEREAALIMFTLASTFTFLHEEGVCWKFCSFCMHVMWCVVKIPLAWKKFHLSIFFLGFLKPFEDARKREYNCLLEKKNAKKVVINVKEQGLWRLGKIKTHYKRCTVNIMRCRFMIIYIKIILCTIVIYQ